MIKILNSIFDQNNLINRINQQDRAYHIDFSSSFIKIQIYNENPTPIGSIEEIASDLTTYNILPSIKNIMDLFDIPITKFHNVIIENSGQREISIIINLKRRGYNNIKIEKRILEYALNTDIPDSITDKEVKEIRQNTEKHFIDKINRNSRFKFQVLPDFSNYEFSYSTSINTANTISDALSWTTAI